MSGIITEDLIGVFIAGMAAGLFLYRLIIAHVIGHFPNTLCDYCEFARKRSSHRRDG